MSEVSNEPKLTNAKFKDFLKTFDNGEHDNHKFYDTITEISRKHSANREPLIENDFKMYSLDDIAKGSEILSDNLPKTADAVYFNDKKGILYLIEFKFHNLDYPDPADVLEFLVDEFYDKPKKFKCMSKYKKDLYKIKNYYGDDVKHTLILKPVESVKVAIPRLYHEYDPNISEKEIEKFIDTLDKILVVFVSHYTEEGKFNPHHEIMESMSTGLEKHFERLKTGSIIDDYKIHARVEFDDFLDKIV